MHIYLRSPQPASALAFTQVFGYDYYRDLFKALLFASFLSMVIASSAEAALHQDEDNTVSDIVIECGEPPESSGGGGGGGSDPGDASTKNRKMYGPCSVQPTPHRTTPKSSPISDLNPNAFVYLKNKGDSNSGGGSGNSGGGEDDSKERVWQDAAYGRGTPGDALTSKRPVGDDKPINEDKDISSEYDKPGAKPRLNAARPMIKPSQKPKDRKEEACLNRVKWDNAVNQTIMEAAKFPFNKEGQRQIAWEDESKPGGKLSLKNHCQGLKMTMDGKEEYKAGTYIKAAYEKSLRDPNYRLTGSSASSAFKTEPTGPLFASLIANANAAKGEGEFDEPGVEGLQQYENKYPECSQCENIRINQILSVPQEEITDVTHPFTPRWHYKDNERNEFSPKGKEYAKYEKDNVRCAGDAEKNKVKVDILEFRRPPFEKGINQRITQNQQCFRNQIRACCTKAGCKPVPCWKCFGQNGKTDTPPCSTRHNQEDLTVLNAYKSLVPNRKLNCQTSAASLCEKLRAPYRMVNKLKIRRAQKGHPKDRLPNGAPEGYSHIEYFANRMPYPIQHDTGRAIQDTPSTTQLATDFAGQYATLVGVGREKRSAGGSGSSSTTTFIDSNETAFANLFGLSSPAHAASSSSGSSGGEPTNKEKDERCMMGGWGKDAQCSGMKFKKPNPMTSWTELKAYQARTIQDYSIACIGQYHKLYSPGNAEGKALMRAGGVYEREICSKKDDKGNSTECGGSSSGGASSGGGSSTGGSSGSGGGSSGKEFWEKRQQQWPLAYRGRMCNKKDFDEDQKKDCKKRECFPFFGVKDGKCPELKTGLDEAKPGDIILMFAGGVKEEDSGGASSGGASSGSSTSSTSSSSSGSDSDDEKKPLMPTLAYVKAAHNSASTKDYKDCSQDKNCNLIVESSDDGQFPDACGNSFNWGGALSRTLYKPGNMPESYKEKIKDIQKKNDVKNPSTNCVNPQFGACEYEDWDKAKVYRPSDDVRDKENGGGSSSGGSSTGG